MSRVKNQALIEGLRAYFPGRLENSFQWPRAIGILQGLPALRAAWVGERDISGNGQTLTFGGNTVVSHHGLAAIVNLPGAAADSLAAADSATLSVIGTEATVVAALRGLTLGCWARIDDLGSGDNYLLAKWESATAANGSYRLYHNGDDIFFSVTSGTTNYTASIADVITVGDWFFAAGRFDPSTNVFVNFNRVDAVGAGSAPASLNDSTVSFRVGARTASADEMNGAIALPFLTASFLPEYFVRAFFDHTRGLFGA